MPRYKLRTLLILLAVLPPLLWIGWGKYQAWRAEQKRQIAIRLAAERKAEIEARQELIAKLMLEKDAAVSSGFMSARQATPEEKAIMERAVEQISASANQLPNRSGPHRSRNGPQ